MKVLISAGALCAAIQIASGQSTNLVTGPDLTQLPLEELLNIEVTSVSRAPEQLSSAPAAITVITGDDIRRMGATTLPDALRLVPGVHVARVDAHTWAVSTRGFSDVFANKQLVMIDGRTVYTPLFSGVFWDSQDTLLEDIDRIEVIRGPGATLWGANAVNGVINIITKSAKETQGLLVSGGTGTEELGFGSVRYGGKINEDVSARVYAKYFNRDDSKLASGDDANDAWQAYRGGFRVDWQPADINLFTFQGDVYSGTLNQTYLVPSTTFPFARQVPGDFEVHGGNLLSRWTHDFSESSQMSLQAYYDYTRRNTEVFEEERETGDLDFQHQFEAGSRQNFVWGLGLRQTEDQAGNTPSVSLFPRKRSDELYSAFIQDDISIVPDELVLTLGTKLEHNDYTGFEVQPNVRLSWIPAEHNSVWASVARAVRTPSRVEHDVQINPPGVPPGFATVFGTEDFESEELIAYEIGYRCQPWSRLSFDIAAFFNDYTDLRSLEPLTAAPIGPRIAANELEGETYGVELSSRLQLAHHCKLHAGYSLIDMHIHPTDDGSDRVSAREYERASPHHQFFTRLSFDFGRELQFGHEFQFDVIARYVDQIEVSRTRVPDYLTADVRLAWRPDENWELALVGQNLLDNQHPEFYPTNIATQRTEVERSVYAKLTWRF